MLRAVTVRNRTSDEISIGDRTIPAFGSLSLSHAEFVEMAISFDLPSYGIEVTMPGEGLKSASVKDFGAKGNGIDDDTTAIQRAIDHVASFGGGVVEVPIGVYITTGILVDGNVFLQGESKLDSVLKLKAGTDNAVVSFSGSNSGMEKIRVVSNG